MFMRRVPFINILSNKILTYRGDKFIGGNKSKERVTILPACNMLFIGKSKKHKCFNNVTSLLIMYKNNSKAWMTKSLFGKCFVKLDTKFMKENKKVILFIDKCIAHYTDSSNLINIKIVFLPVSRSH